MIERNNSGFNDFIPCNLEYRAKIKFIRGYRWYPDEKYGKIHYSDSILESSLPMIKKELHVITLVHPRCTKKSGSKTGEIKILMSFSRGGE